MFNGRSFTCNPGDERFTRVDNWLPVLSFSGYKQPASGWIDFTFTPKSAGCVRILSTQLTQDDYGNRYLQLSEMEVYENNNRVSPADVVVSSQIGSRWSSAFLMDSKEDTVWSSNGHGEHLSSAEWAAVILPGTQSINRIRVLPRTNPGNTSSTLSFPGDFVLLYSLNGTFNNRNFTCNPGDDRFTRVDNWLPVLSFSGYKQPTSGWIDFTFTPKSAGCVRILGTQLTQDDYGNRYLQLSEIQVYAGAR